MEKYIVRFFLALSVFLIALALSSYLALYFRAEPQVYATAANFAVVLLAGLAIIYMLSEGMTYYGIKMHFEKDMAAVVHMFRLFAYVVLAISLFYVLHINITGLLIGAGFLGIVLGLAAQSTLGNVLAGLSIIAAKPFSVGDRVTVSTWQYGMFPATYPHDFTLSGISGTVVKLGLIYTEILRDDGTPAVIPNAILNQALILNHKKISVRTIRIRVELDAKKSIDEFEKRLLVEIKKDKNFTSTLNIAVTDINASSYGVSVTTTYKKGQDDGINEKLARIILKVVSGLR